MANKMILPHGNKENMPSLNEGEVAFASDNSTLYVGNNGKNIPINPVKIHISATEPEMEVGDLWFKIPE